MQASTDLFQVAAQQYENLYKQMSITDKTTTVGQLNSQAKNLQASNPSEACKKLALMAEILQNDGTAIMLGNQLAGLKGAWGAYMCILQLDKECGAAQKANAIFGQIKAYEAAHGLANSAVLNQAVKV